MSCLDATAAAVDPRYARAKSDHRYPVPGDRRLRAVELTDRGRETFHAAEEIGRRTADALLAHPSRPHGRALTGLLVRC
jgi:hypothetical protein